MNVHDDKTVTLDDILAAREYRAQKQAELRTFHQVPVISVSINMPGNIKYTDDVVDLMYAAVNRLRRAIRSTGHTILEERVLHHATGPCTLIAVKGSAVELKTLAVELERHREYGRLLDIDIYEGDGNQVSRSQLGLPARTCLVCGEQAIDCMRGKRHTHAELLNAVKNRFVYFRAADTNLFPKTVERIGTAALEAMLMEVSCTPAPGLVDRDNAGGHQDMDFYTFIKSSSALTMAMYRCAMAGWQHNGAPESLLPVLREIGKEAEQAMFAATEGINTQKGILFLLGVLSAAAALVLRKDPTTLTAKEILTEAAAICSGIVERELLPIEQDQPNRKLTAGERFYVKHGITGIRGEIAAGLPSVWERGMPCLREALRKGHAINEALVHALIALMAVTEDTTILNRHNIEVLETVQRDAADILKHGGALTSRGQLQIRELDTLYSAQRISPGGSADLLAVTYYLYVLEERYIKWREEDGYK